MRLRLFRRGGPEITFDRLGHAILTAGFLEPGTRVKMPNGETAVFVPTSELPVVTPRPPCPDPEPQTERKKPSRPKYGIVNFTPARIHNLRRQHTRKWEATTERDGPAQFYRRERYKP